MTSASSVAGFSLLGGPVRRRLAGAKTRLPVGTRARILVVVAFTWGVLALLSIAEGNFAGAVGERLPFLRDFAVHARYLVALPLLILAEPFVDTGLRPAIARFLEPGLVAERDRPVFARTLAHVESLRDAVAPTALILGLSLIPGVVYREVHTLQQTSSWLLTATAEGEQLTVAGWWHVFVASAVSRFIVYRWVWRILLWAALVWRVSRLDLLLMPTHPDLAGGLGFLSLAQVRFGIVFCAVGVVVAAALGTKLAYRGASVGELKSYMIGYAVAAMVLLLAPLALVSGKLIRVKRRGLLEYGLLADEYTAAFDRKWVHPSSQAAVDTREALLGTPDLQSLADLGSSFEVVRNMRIVPLDKTTVIIAVAWVALPLVPLLVAATPTGAVLRTLSGLIMG